VGDVIYRLRHMSGRVTVPPMIKLALLVALGLVPFIVFALLQSDGGLTGDSDETSQPISNRQIPLAFPFDTPEAPSTAPVSESTTTTPAAAPTAAQCADGKDNDLDGRVDLRDTGCSSRQDNNEAQAVTTTRRSGSVTTTVPPLPTTPPPIPTTAPPTTTSPPPPPPPSTAPPPPTQPPPTALRMQGECSDGKDNDGDGKTDLADRASCHGDPTQDE
jgi:hypothetical protein